MSPYDLTKEEYLTDISSEENKQYKQISRFV